MSVCEVDREKESFFFKKQRTPNRLGFFFYMQENEMKVEDVFFIIRI